ncbi:hypothetical protein K492DRAFT_203251, partial [Lichtheimia hyalospora FSU 10163]
MKHPKPISCLTTQRPPLLEKTAFHLYHHLVRVNYPIIEDNLIAFPRIYPMVHPYRVRINHHCLYRENLFHHHHPPVTCIFSIIFHIAPRVVLLIVHPPSPQAPRHIPWIVYIQMSYSCLIIDTLLAIKKKSALALVIYQTPPLSSLLYSHIGLESLKFCNNH